MLRAELFDDAYEFADFVFESFDGVELDAGGSSVGPFVCSRVAFSAAPRRVKMRAPR